MLAAILARLDSIPLVIPTLGMAILQSFLNHADFPANTSWLSLSLYGWSLGMSES